MSTHATRAALGALVLVSRLAVAVPCPAPVGVPALEQVDSELRLRFIEREMTENARRLRIWSLTWGSIYAAATAGQAVGLVLVQDSGVRIDLAAGMIAAAVGSASLYLLPLRIILPSKRVSQSLAGEDRCQVLAEVEPIFLETAKIDRLSGSWIAHAGNVAINAALALILGLGYGRWTTAAISAAVGLAVGEANLLTQPHGLANAEKRYRAGQLGEERPAVSWGVAPVISERMKGIAVSGMF